MPFDGTPPAELPMEIRLLDRTRSLIDTPDRWIKKEFTRYLPNGEIGYCIYGALFAAEKELCGELPWYIETHYEKADFIKHKRRYFGTAFGHVHTALNIEARPLTRYFSRDQTYAIKYNDTASSVYQVHELMNRARNRLLRNMALTGRS